MMWSELGKNIRVVIEEIYENQQLYRISFRICSLPQRHYFSLHLETISFISFILKYTYIWNKLIESINSLRSSLCPSEAYHCVASYTTE